MAFDGLPGMRVTISQNPQSFIIGDYFAVYDKESDVPDVYEWSMLKSYTELPGSFIITLLNGSSYTITKNCFSDASKLIAFRSIVEGQISNYSHITKKVTKRIIPPKYNYRTADVATAAFSAAGTYTERDINSGSVAKVYSRFAWIIWVAAIVSAVVTFLCLAFIGGKVEENLIYYICLSLFSGVAFAVVIYLICCTTARYRYANYVRSDVTTTENIIFVVSSNGFAAVEECVYTGKELIPWSKAMNYFETKHTIVIMLKDRSVCRIPKRLFPKKTCDELGVFIASNLLKE